MSSCNLVKHWCSCDMAAEMRESISRKEVQLKRDFSAPSDGE
jgi:hypothetical protein